MSVLQKMSKLFGARENLHKIMKSMCNRCVPVTLKNADKGMNLSSWLIQFKECM